MTDPHIGSHRATAVGLWYNTCSITLRAKPKRRRACGINSNATLSFVASHFYICIFQRQSVSGFLSPLFFQQRN